MAHTMGDRVDTVVLSDEQFNKLVELLTPGYEASKMFLAEHKAHHAAPTEGEAAVTIPPPNEMTGG